jgi:hypothetical protein
MKWLRSWKAALLGVGVLGLLSVTGGGCAEWMCGTNHNQVLL